MRLDASALPTASGALDGGNGDERDDRKKTNPRPRQPPNPILKIKPVQSQS